VQEPVEDPELPVPGAYLLVWRDIPTKAGRNLDEERVSLIATVAIKPVL
jgi:hypothetical protein